MVPLASLCFVICAVCVSWMNALRKEAHEQARHLRQAPPEQWLDSRYFFRFWVHIGSLARQSRDDELQKLVQKNWIAFWLHNLSALVIVVCFLVRLS